MEELFPEWYRPSGSEVAQLYREATIVLDANVLLSLYRTSPAEREELLRVLRRVQDRLWIPYQAALEYQRNRLDVIHAQTRVYAAVNAAIADLEEKIQKALDQHRAHKPLAESMAEAFASGVSKLRERVDVLQGEHGLGLDEMLESDPVRDALDGLLVGRLGSKPPEDRLKERLAEAQRRAEKGIPPGYLDRGKDSPERSAGDYLLWAEVLDMAAGSGRPTLLITDDRKPDWFLVVAGRTVGPRPELVAEFRAVSSHRYHQQHLRQFLQHAGEFLETPVDKATIDRVAPERRTKVSGEETLAALRHILEQQQEPSSATLAAFRRVMEQQQEPSSATLAAFRHIMEQQQEPSSATLAAFRRVMAQQQEPSSTTLEAFRRVMEQHEPSSATLAAIRHFLGRPVRSEAELAAYRQFVDRAMPSDPAVWMDGAAAERPLQSSDDDDA